MQSRSPSQAPAARPALASRLARGTSCAIGAAALLLLGACESTPWACTPESCGAIATIDLPETVYGDWVSVDERLRIAGIYKQTNEAYTLMPSAAALVGDGLHNARLYSTGPRYVAEWSLTDTPMGRGRDARRFARVTPAGSTLLWQELDLDALPSGPDEPFRHVTREQGEALVYRDIAAMADRIEQLTAADEFWDDGQLFERAN